MIFRMWWYVWPHLADKPALTQEPRSHISLASALFFSQNLLVCVHSLICTDRHPHQIWLRKWAGVCKTSYRPTCSVWYQRRHEHHCQRTVALSFLGDGSAAAEGWYLQVPNIRGYTALSYLGERLGNLADHFLTFTALCSVSLQKGHPHEHQHSIISGPSGPTFKWLLIGLLISYSDISHYSLPE